MLPSNRSRFLSLIFVLVLCIAVRTTSSVFYGDFWEHAALVRYLSTDLSGNSHPFFYLTAQHAFISPYILLVALSAIAFDISPINALATSGVLNFILFYLGLYFWIKRLSPKFCYTSSIYALLAILFLWGHDPWGYSGFLHYQILLDVLTYPSTFALAITLLALSINSNAITQQRFFQLFFVFLLFYVVMLTHPLTAIFFGCGLIAQLWCVSTHQLSRRIFINGVFGLIAIGLATQWPYYSIVELATGAGDVYHPENKSMYVDVLARIWPTLVALPLASWAIKDRAGQSVILIILMLTGVYIYGGLTEKYSFGRVISIIMILMQILIAVGLARLEIWAIARLPALRILIPVALFGSLLYLSMPWLVATSTRALTVANSIRLGRPISLQHSYKDLLFLEQQVDAKSVVLSDINTSWIVPSIRGKVVGALHPQAFVPDQRQRFNDVNTFFEPTTTIQQQIAIAKKYHVDFLLLNKETTPQYQELVGRFTGDGKGKITYTSNKYILIKLSLLN